MAKSILAKHRTLPISDTLVIEEYTYVYIDGLDAERGRERHLKENKRGWIKVAFERECTHSKQGHMWTYRSVWQKKTANRL